jgi:hypothetical protein
MEAMYIEKESVLATFNPYYYHYDLKSDFSRHVRGILMLMVI